MMSIGLAIANITGSIRALPAGAAGIADAAPQAEPATAANKAASELLSGQAQFTPGFTVLVLQLLNDKGAVVSTIPTTQQLAAYRNGTATPPT